MRDLSTEYLGLRLRNPFVASSSGHTGSIEKIKQLAEAGIGAVVLKSLFEEQIVNQANVLSATEDYPEAADYISNYIQSNAIDEYVDLVADAKQESGVPIIASINCVGSGKWVEFAGRLEKAGADAIELNKYLLPTDPYKPASFYEEQYFETVKEVVSSVKIPVSVKLSRNFTNPLYVLQQLHFLGARGCVLYNRYYEMDIELKSGLLCSADLFSKDGELAPTLRWLALASAKVEGLDLAVSTGVHSGDDAAKALLVGATAVQVCTVLYQHGSGYVKTLIEELSHALEVYGAESVEAMRGRLNYRNISNPVLFERSQFMKYFSSHE